MFPTLKDDASYQTDEPADKKTRLTETQEEMILRLTNRIKELEIEVNTLKLQLNQTKTQQIHKDQINDFLHKLFGITLSDSVLVDITLKENDPKLIISGRPPVPGSSKNQMRHITPFSFVKEFIKSIIQSTQSPNELIQEFANKITVFLEFDTGLCLKEDIYDQIDPEISEYLHQIKIETKNNTYYLIGDQQIQANWLDHLGLTTPQLEEARKEYLNRKADVFQYTINTLQESINDHNTLNITCELLSRFILTLFNQKACISFPKQGNTLIYEIRLYDTMPEAIIGNDNYQIITARDIAEGIDIGDNPTEIKLRIVDIEGPQTQKIIEALKQLSAIFDRYTLQTKYTENLKALQSKLDNYNVTSNIKIYFTNRPCSTEITENYNNNLQDSSYLLTHIFHHIAKYLYLVFDFKALEKTVLASTKPSDQASKPLEIFELASGIKQKTFYLQDGKNYRKTERENLQKKYPKTKINFRLEETDLRLLANKTIDHLEISLKAFFTTTLTSKDHIPIIESFIKLIEFDYEMDMGTENTMILSNFIHSSRYWSEIQDSSTARSSIHNVTESDSVMF